MADFENDYLLFRNDLILKYGEQSLKTPANKSLALLMLSGSFKRVPNSASFDEEIAILQNVIDNIGKPEVKNDFNQIQDGFRTNRYSEIVKENKDSSYFNSPTNKTIDDKISAAETLGLVASGMTDKKTTTGHTIGEVVTDLHNLYILQYKLYRQTPQHPIFLNAVLENSDFPKAPQQPVTGAGNNKGGCLGVVLFLVIPIVTILYFV